MMLIHIGQTDIAAKVHNAWLRTIEDGQHTYDIYNPEVSKIKLGTKEFTQAVIDRLGEMPKTLKAVEYKPFEHDSKSYSFLTAPKAKKETVGVDVYIHWSSGTPADLGSKLSGTANKNTKLTMISNRGLKVWPEGLPDLFCSDHWRCRFESVKEGNPVTHEDIIEILQNINKAGFDFVKSENLCTFNGVKGFSLAQGQ
jgi:isocitrate dehydrogenase